MSHRKVKSKKKKKIKKPSPNGKAKPLLVKSDSGKLEVPNILVRMCSIGRLPPTRQSEVRRRLVFLSR